MSNVKLLEQPFLYASKKYNFDIEKLEKEAIALFNDTGLDAQVSLKHRENINEDSRWSDGIGAALGAGRILVNKDFTVFNEKLKGSYLETVHDTMAKDYTFGRMRLMKLTGKRCLTWHIDLEKRIHIPIVTNEKCLVIVDDEVCRLPADGNPYLVDTTKPHTVLNGNLKFDRIHLIFDLL